MTSKKPRETAKPTYQSPTVTVVGMVSELTAGPIVKDAESSGGFRGSGRARAPRTDDAVE